MFMTALSESVSQKTDKRTGSALRPEEQAAGARGKCLGERELPDLATIGCRVTV